MPRKDAVKKAERIIEILSRLRKEEAGVAMTPEQAMENEQVKSVIDNWEKEGLLTEEILDSAVTKMKEMYTGNELDEKHYIARFLSVLHNEVFFGKNEKFDQDALDKIRKVIIDIYKRLNIDLKADDGENKELLETILKQIKYAPYYEFLNVADKDTKYFFITSVDNLNKKIITEEEWKSQLDETQKDRASLKLAKSDVLIRGNIMSLERYIMMQVISLKLKGINGQGRLEEFIWKKIREDANLVNWLNNDKSGNPQARQIIPYLKAYYVDFYKIMNEQLLKLENMRDKRGAGNGAKEGVRHHMFSMIWEEYNDFFRYLLKDEDVKLEINSELEGKIKGLREEIEQKIKDIFDKPILEEQKDKKEKITADQQKELERLMRALILTGNEYFGLPREKHRLKMYQVYNLMFKYLFKAIFKGEASSRFKSHLVNLSQQFAIYGVWILTLALFAYTAVNALKNMDLLGIPHFASLPFGYVSLAGLIVYITSWLVGYKIRKTALKNSDPADAVKWHKIQLGLQGIGIILAIAGLFFGPALPLFATSFVIPDAIRTILILIPYLIFFETFRLTPYAMHYAIKAVLTQYSYWKNDVYHLKPWKNTKEVGKEVYRLITTKNEKNEDLGKNGRKAFKLLLE